MNFKWYAVFMGFGTGISWIAWIIILQTMDPGEIGVMGHAFFYATLFLALLGTGSLLGILYRLGIKKRTEMLVREVRTAFRHSLLLSSLAVVCLWLAAKGFFYWYYFLLLLILLVLLEYLFLTVFEAKRG